MTQYRKRIIRRKGNSKSSLSPPQVVLMALGTILLIGAGFLLLPKSESDPRYIPEVTGGASLKVDREKIDFGDLRFNEIVTAEFELTNVGNKTLQFTKDPYIEVRDGC